MAQLTGTAGRSASHVLAAFVAGTLLATAVLATGIILALALGLDGSSSTPRAGVTTYDGRLDPIETEYIRRVPSAPRAGVTTYDGRLDPIETEYIRRSHSVAPADSAPLRGGLPRYHLVPS